MEGNEPVWRRASDGGGLPDSVVTRVYHLCRLVSDIADGVVPRDRITGEQVGGAARAFIAAVDNVDGPGSERGDRQRNPEQVRAGESRERHIERVVRDHAEPAFWSHVVRAFPHVETGDFGPEDVSVLQNAMERAIEEWLRYNERGLQPTHDQMAAFGQMMHEASIGAYGITQTVTGFLAEDGRRVPSPSQAGGPIDPVDYVVIIGAEDDENAEEPGTARTFVQIIPPHGARRCARFYEVQ